VALADEFLLLKAQMSAMQRQFETVLAEIEIELDARPANTEVKDAVSQPPPHQDSGPGPKFGARVGEAKGGSTVSLEIAGVVPHLPTSNAEALEAGPSTRPHKPAGNSVKLVAQCGAHGPVSPFPYNAIVLGGRREQAIRKTRRATGATTRHWVTLSIGMLAAIAGAAVGSSFGTH
jgi:hypothetical protein